MDLQTLGTVLGGFASLAATGGGFARWLWMKFEERSRYHEAREELLFRRVELYRGKVAEIAGVAGVSVNGEFEARNDALDREWDALLRRGRA